MPAPDQALGWIIVTVPWVLVVILELRRALEHGRYIRSLGLVLEASNQVQSRLAALEDKVFTVPDEDLEIDHEAVEMYDWEDPGEEDGIPSYSGFETYQASTGELIGKIRKVHQPKGWSDIDPNVELLVGSLLPGMAYLTTEGECKIWIPDEDTASRLAAMEAKGVMGNYYFAITFRPPGFVNPVVDADFGSDEVPRTQLVADQVRIFTLPD